MSSCFYLSLYYLIKVDTLYSGSSWTPSSLHWKASLFLSHGWQIKQYQWLCHSRTFNILSVTTPKWTSHQQHRIFVRIVTEYLLLWLLLFQYVRFVLFNVFVKVMIRVSILWHLSFSIHWNIWLLYWQPYLPFTIN